jgi:serine phosphatase RsbU (regulator of sigma subunit)
MRGVGSAKSLLKDYGNVSDSFLKDEMNKIILIQDKLLNGEQHKLKGGEITGVSLPAKLIGGDFYDIYPLENGKIRIVIGDVMGKGITASMLMILTRGAFRSAAERTNTPGETLATINQALYKDLRKLKSFVTLFCADWDQESGNFTYANAGHHLPLILNGHDKTVKTFPKLSGIMVGGLPNQLYKEDSITLKNNDSVFFFTDGIVEAQNKKGELFQLERLIASIADYQNKEGDNLDQFVMETLYEFTEGSHQRDDITMVLLKINR